MARRAYDATDLDETFSAKGWRSELDVYYRQRRSVWFVMAAVICLAAFQEDRWAWVAFFGAVTGYAAISGVRIGVLCAGSFTIWFTGSIEGWWWSFAVRQAVGLWCIGMLFLLVVWKADGVHQLRDRYGGAPDAPHD